MFVYLDNSATTRQYDRVTAYMKESMDDFYGNPSSLHSFGLDSEKKVRQARKNIAESLGCGEEEIVFTSGGTESDNTAIFGAARSKKRNGKKIITSKVEHPAVLEACKALENEGYTVEYIGVDSQCRLDMDQLQAAVDDETILISIMTVNNETGTVMPVDQIAQLKKNALFHTDSVQAYGKMKLKAGAADLMSLSAHKIHGPKGMGALYVRKGVRIPAYLVGGGQERHMRSGTENVPGILGFGLAARIASENLESRLDAMAEAKNYLLAGLQDQIEDLRINTPADSVPSVLNVSFLGTRGEVLLHTLEQDGIFVSTGSACSSNKKGRSHVLAAMGLSDKEIEGAVRFSFSEFNTVKEMDYVLEKTKNAVTRFRKLGSFR
ncbi:MAG: cysteine desulfurase family protein [Anaerovoracaceae bacterium]